MTSLARCAALGLLAVGLFAPAQSGDGHPGSGGGAPAPDFRRPTLDGRTLHLQSLRGRVVLLNFWASWCGPCLQELPAFSQWQREDGHRGLAVVGISMDDDAGPARAAADRLRLSFPVIMGDAFLARAYGGVLGIPVSILIGRDGTVQQRIEGEPDLSAMHQAILALLAGTPTRSRENGVGVASLDMPPKSARRAR